MIGFRFWDIALDKKEDPVLTSATAPFKWSHNVVGEPIDHLAKINQKKSCYYDENLGDWVEWFFEDDNDFIVPEIGFWAFNKIGRAVDAAADWEGNPMIVGVINGFGKIAKHNFGFRSEFSQILGIWNTIPCPWHPANKADYFFYQYYNQGFCKEHPDSQKFLSKPLVQFSHDKILKDLVKKYEVDLLSYNQLKEMENK